MMRPKLSIGIAAGLFGLMSSSLATAQVAEDRVAQQATVLRLDDARAMADRALAEAARSSLDISIAIVNREGRLILANRMDGSSFLHLAVAERKAVTAAAMGAPSSTLESAVDGGKPSLLSVPELAMIGGGLPILVGDRIVGGIGISGGSPAQDEAIATAALRR